MRECMEEKESCMIIRRERGIKDVKVCRSGSISAIDMCSDRNGESLRQVSVRYVNVYNVRGKLG